MGRNWLLLLVPACFNPVYSRPACGPGGECPGALVCVQSVCELASDGGASHDAPQLDGSVAGDAAMPDAAMPDSRPDAAPGCFGAGLVQVCFTTLPDEPVSLPRTQGALDTSNDQDCDQVLAQQGGPSLCVIAGTRVTVSGSLTAIGSRPLVLVGVETVTVTELATINVSSTSSPVRKGAGGNEVTCSPSGNGGNDSGGGGGGAGGSFGSVGGNGGTGDLDDTGGPLGPAAGGVAGAAQTTPSVLRGGCSGGTGGSGPLAPAGGPGGHGGGAVYLIAGNQITIDGNMFASGGGGRVTEGDSTEREGGGGGGSGGMIGLDAPAIQIVGRVVANGGAGGGGGNNDREGDDGRDGTTATWNVRAQPGKGASGTPGGGDGAPGTAIGTTTNIDGASAGVGGGGGAGGLGLILTYGALSGGAMISPPPVQR